MIETIVVFVVAIVGLSLLLKGDGNASPDLPVPGLFPDAFEITNQARPNQPTLKNKEPISVEYHLFVRPRGSATRDEITLRLAALAKQKIFLWAQRYKSLTAVLSQEAHDDLIRELFSLASSLASIEDATATCKPVIAHRPEKDPLDEIKKRLRRRLDVREFIAGEAKDYDAETLALLKRWLEAHPDLNDENILYPDDLSDLK